MGAPGQSASHSILPDSLRAGQRLARALHREFWGMETRRLWVLATLVGLVCGVAAFLLFSLLNAAQSIFLKGTQDELRAPLWIIAMPALGGLIIGPFLARFAPEARGHGVPEVLNAVNRHGARIPFRVAVTKIIASAVSIGSGGSAGREGPIVQAGAAVGSAIGRFFNESTDILRMLVACGAAGGIAASFNSPLGGVVFALEVILRDFAGRAFGMVVASAVSASVVARTLMGGESFFQSADYTLKNSWEVPLYALLGVLCAVGARGFIHFMDFMEERFERSRIPLWLQPALGGLGVGVIGYFLPMVLATGHNPVETALAGELGLGMLVLLMLAKPLATGLTLGSGGSGGVFAPSLFTGAMMGGLFGLAAGRLLPEITGPPGGYALVGMGAFFAGASFAPMTAVLIVSEMTRDYAMTLPLMMACVTAVLVSHHLSPDSIFTIRLRRKGIILASPVETASDALPRAGQVMRQGVDSVPQAMPLGALVERFRNDAVDALPVTDAEGRLVGLVTVADLREAMVQAGDLAMAITADVMRMRPPSIPPDERLSDAAARMHREGLQRLPVVGPDGRLAGMLSEHDILAAMMGSGQPGTGSAS